MRPITLIVFKNFLCPAAAMVAAGLILKRIDQWQPQEQKKKEVKVKNDDKPP